MIIESTLVFICFAHLNKISKKCTKITLIMYVTFFSIL